MKLDKIIRALISGEKVYNRSWRDSDDELYLMFMKDGNLYLSKRNNLEGEIMSHNSILDIFSRYTKRWHIYSPPVEYLPCSEFVKNFQTKVDWGIITNYPRI
jgi:hypothetical protein